MLADDGPIARPEETAALGNGAKLSAAAESIDAPR